MNDPTGTHDRPLQLGALIFPNIDQMDFTGPFEVLCRLPNSKFHIVAKTTGPVRDAHGLMLTPQLDFAACPPLDVLIIPGGGGVDALFEDEATVKFIQRQAVGARIVFSICTGALLLGAAGLLRGRRATTHWASHQLLSLVGAIPVDERVVIDGNVVTAAGVTAGFDGAFRIAALLRGEDVARRIQLEIEYDPHPPYDSGTPAKAPSAIVEAARTALANRLDRRAAVLREVGAPLR